jgi:hypothetical protein
LKLLRIIIPTHCDKNLNGVPGLELANSWVSSVPLGCLWSSELGNGV